jgi:hypothetical protein
MRLFSYTIRYTETEDNKIFDKESNGVVVATSYAEAAARVEKDYEWDEEGYSIDSIEIYEQDELYWYTQELETKTIGEYERRV